jgi:hypothetical protein
VKLEDDPYEPDDYATYQSGRCLSSPMLDIRPSLAPRPTLGYAVFQIRIYHKSHSITANESPPSRSTYSQRHSLALPPLANFQLPHVIITAPLNHHRAASSLSSLTTEEEHDAETNGNVVGWTIQSHVMIMQVTPTTVLMISNE